MFSWPSRRLSTGIISGTRISAETAISTHGLPVTRFDQWPHMPVFSGSSEGCSHFGSAIESMKRPASDISAGSSVMAASTAIATATAAV